MKKIELEREIYFRPRPAFELLDLLVECTNTKDLKRTGILTCNPVFWVQFLTEIYPDVLINVAPFFTRQLRGYENKIIGHEPDDISEYFDVDVDDFIENCENVDDIVDFISKSKYLENIVLDFTIPFGGKGGVFSEITSFLSDKFQKSKTLQSHTSLMLSAILAERCNSVQRIVCHLPTGSLFNQSAASCREYIKSIISLQTIIELPAGMLYPPTHMKTCVAIFEKRAVQNATIFYNLSDESEFIDVETQPWLKDMQGTFAGYNSKHGFAAKVEGDAPWTSNYHRPSTLKLPQSLVEMCEMVKIGDQFEIILGARFSRDLQKKKNMQYVVRGRDLGKTKHLDFLEKFSFDRKVPERAIVKRNDILIQKIGQKPTVVIAGDLEGAVAGDTVVVLRAFAEDTPVSSIHQFLTSKFGSELLASSSQTSTVPTLSVTGLKNLSIPVLPDWIDNQLIEAQKIEGEIRRIADRLGSFRSSLMNTESKEELEEQLIDLKTRTKVYTKSIAASGEVNYRIKNFFPFPLAYPFRMLEGLIDPGEKYRQQLRVAENILAFLGSITLALVHPTYTEADIDIVKLWRGGVSPGNWEEIALKGSMVLSEERAGGLAFAQKSLWKGKKKPSQFSKDIRTLIKLKNDYKHDRGPQIGSDFEEAINEVDGLLFKCMSSLEYFLQFPIRLVCDLDVDRFSKKAIMKTLKYEGDHQALQQEKVHYPEPLSKNTLYIEINPDEWVTLFPYISVHSCHKCKLTEIYYIDRWQGGGTEAKVKSFERGHTENVKEIGDTLSSFLL